MYHMLAPFIVNHSIPYWSKKGFFFEQTLCHKISSETVRTVCPGIRHFIFCDRVFAQSRKFYENSMESLDLGESWLACGYVYNGCDYQNTRTKKEKLLTVMKNKCPPFYPSVYQNKNHMISYPGRRCSRTNTVPTVSLNLATLWSQV